MPLSLTLKASILRMNSTFILLHLLLKISASKLFASATIGNTVWEGTMIFACFFRLAPTGALLYSPPCFLGCKDLFYSPLLFSYKATVHSDSGEIFQFQQRGPFERKIKTFGQGQ